MDKILTQLLSKIDYIKIDGKVDTDIKISSLVFDTRQVKDGSLFFALPGTHVHGNKFICKAIELGAVAIIYQDELPEDAKLVVRTESGEVKYLDSGEVSIFSKTVTE